uniref:Spectrin alpha, non-erythrocytic 1 n=1 Tax=Oryzias melastigma TaxID=30732 RepID=A0A3B3CL67_ORYME
MLPVNVLKIFFFCIFIHAFCLFIQLLSRRNALHERAQSRRAALEDSFHLQQFFRDSDELKSWINEKMKTATDESYKVETRAAGG